MMVVTCRCSYAAKVPDQFSGQSVKCPRCGSELAIGGGLRPVALAVATPPAGPAVVLERCEMCDAVIAPKEKDCRRCGWDKKDQQRKCVHCHMPIVHDDGPGFGQYQGALVGVAGIVLFKFIGILGVLSIICGLASLSGLSSVMLMRYRCGGCEKDVDPALLSGQENRYMAKRRFSFLMASIGLGVATIACIVLWVAIARSFGSD